MVQHIQIAIADEAASSRQYVRTILESQSDFKIVDEVGSSLGDIVNAVAMNPEILIYTITTSSDLHIVRLIHDKYPRLSCIALARLGAFNTEEALRFGAKSVIRWNDIGTRLIKTVRDVADARAYTEEGGTLEQMMISDFSSPTSYSDDPLLTLTRRELEVFDLFVQGYNNAKIATKLCISRRTVELHRANMLRKLGLQNFQQQLQSLASQRGLIRKESM